MARLAIPVTGEFMMCRPDALNNPFIPAPFPAGSATGHGNCCGSLLVDGQLGSAFNAQLISIGFDRRCVLTNAGKAFMYDLIISDVQDNDLEGRAIISQSGTFATPYGWADVSC